MLFVSQCGVASGQFPDAVFTSGLRALGYGTASGGRPDLARTMHQTFMLDRPRRASDQDDVSIPAGYFRRHWDTEYDLEVPLPMDVPAVPINTYTLQAVNRAATF